MGCKCKEKVDKLSKYSDEGSDRKHEVGFFGKIYRVVSGVLMATLLTVVGIALLPIGVVIIGVRVALGKKTNINLKKIIKKKRKDLNGR